MIERKPSYLTCTTLVFNISHKVGVKLLRNPNYIAIVISDFRKLPKITCFHRLILNRAIFNEITVLVQEMSTN